jgi:glycosyltransferase involved in cell wall biosynthesis
MLRVVVNAIPTRPGGGLTVLLGVLGGWRAVGAQVETTVLVGDRRTLAAVTTARHADCILPVLLDAGTGRQFAWQNTSLGSLLRRLAPDVLLTTNHGLFGIDCPVVVHHQNLKRFVHADAWWRGAPDLREAIRDRLARRGLRRAAANVFISSYMRRMAERLVPESAPRNHTVLNGVSDDLIDAARRLPDCYDGLPQLAAIQSPSPYKDTPTLLRTLAVLRRRDPGTGWRLNIAGGCGRGGWDSSRQLATELGVARYVSWLGYSNESEIDRLLRESLCLVFPSALEGFGLPLIESMARRCPVVAARAAAAPEVVADAGILVEPRNPEEFASAILLLHRDRSQRSAFVGRGLERARRFRWSRSAAQLLEILKLAAKPDALASAGPSHEHQLAESPCGS